MDTDYINALESIVLWLYAPEDVITAARFLREATEFSSSTCYKWALWILKNRAPE